MHLKWGEGHVMPLVVPSTSEASGLATYIMRMSRIPELQATYVVREESELHELLPDDARVVFTDGSTQDLARVIDANAKLHEGVQTHGARALLAARKARVSSSGLGHVFHEFPWGTRGRGWAELGFSARVLRAANSDRAARIPRRLGLRCFSVLPPILEKPDTLPCEEAREKLGLPRSRLQIGVVGRLSPAKEPILAAEAFAKLSPSIRDKSDLVFIGEGPLRSDLETASLQPTVSLNLLGHIPDAATLVRAFDVLMVPSRHETFGLSMAEALLADVPVAATRSPGSELLQRAGAALDLAEPDPVDLARIIEGALTKPQVQGERLLETFGLTPLTSVYMEYFEELARRSGRSVQA